MWRTSQIPPSAWRLQFLGPVEKKLRVHSHIESSHSLRQNDARLQTDPPSTLNVEIPNMPKINVYNFKYKISVGNVMKLFFLSHKCINKRKHKLENK